MAWILDGRPESRILQLIYNEPSERLVVQFERDIGERHSVRSVYARHRHLKKYENLFGPNEFTSAHAIASAANAPLLFVQVLAAVDHNSPPGGWRTDEIVCIDLTNGSARKVIDAAQYADRMKLAELVAVDSDGTRVVCRGLVYEEAPERDSSYSLVSIDVATGACEVIARLEETFF